MSRSYRQPWLRMECRWRGLKRAARRAHRADTATARMMCGMPRACRDWAREESGPFYVAEASVDDRERRRSAYKRARVGRGGVRGWMCYMFRRDRDGSPNKWHVIGSRK